jgi:hypothetical protein
MTLVPQVEELLRNSSPASGSEGFFRTPTMRRKAQPTFESDDPRTASRRIAAQFFSCFGFGGVLLNPDDEKEGAADLRI